jgi:Acetyltransferases, including N-acetylases of ribosomal proteins
MAKARVSRAFCIAVVNWEDEMTYVHELETERLLLRQWKETDFPAFASMCADPETMRYFPSALSEEESWKAAQRYRELLRVRGWGLWAVEYKAENQFIGFIGLNIPSVELPFSPCVEIGWRLERNYWGKGLATEGARAVLDFAFDVLTLPEVVSFTALGNERSQRVMQKLGMVRDEMTFQHPAIPEGHALREHVLYRKKCR